MPYPSYVESARTLDRQRLGKQRVETLQIMNALLLNKGWINHPATRMWAGYERGLMLYQIAVCSVWKGRGYKDTCLGKTGALWRSHGRPGATIPPWLGNKRFHLGHQSVLLQKNEEHYRAFFPDADNTLDYWWPVQKGEK